MIGKLVVCQVVYRPVNRSESIGLYSTLLIIALIHSPGCTGAYAGPAITMPAGPGIWSCMPIVGPDLGHIGAISIIQQRLMAGNLRFPTTNPNPNPNNNANANPNANIGCNLGPSCYLGTYP